MPIPLLLHGTHLPPPHAVAGGRAPTTAVTYQPFGPWIVPWRYESLEVEYRALRTGVGLLDYSMQALIHVQGGDRVSFLHNLLTNDIKRLTPGTGCHAALLTANAKLIAELLVLAHADAIWLLCDAARVSVAAAVLERYLFSEAVTIANEERRYALLALQGPRTMEALTAVTGATVSLPRPGDHAALTVEGMTVRVVRWSLAGEVGVLCAIAAEEAIPFWRLCQERGRRAGVRPVGWEALNTARIEAGTPWFGIDMTEENLLPETGLETTAVSETKGCYLGQEIIARLSTYGSAGKKLAGLLIAGDATPEPGDVIARDGEEVGRVTSACASPALKRPIAMGYVKRGSYEPGTAVEIRRGETPLPATVVERPFHVVRSQ